MGVALTQKATLGSHILKGTGRFDAQKNIPLKLRCKSIASAMLKVKEVWVYPIKGCRGILMTSEWPVTARGFALDRNWMVVREDTGRFISQRELPKLCLVETALSSESLIVTAQTSLGQLVLPTAHDKNASLRKVSCWDWNGLAADCGDEASNWFTNYLGRNARLVRFMGDFLTENDDTVAVKRPVTEEFGGELDEIAFNDEHPFLMACTSSLEDLNAKLPPDVNLTLEMNRFRPNIIIECAPQMVCPGNQAWVEDSWSRLLIGETNEFEVMRPCGRCKVPTIDQSTGEHGDEPSETLHKHRSGRVLGWVQPKSFTHSIFFGIQCAPRGVLGSIACGDEVKVLETKEPGQFKPRK